MQNDKKYYSVVFLPWINIHQELSYSNLKLVPWPQSIEKHVTDQNLLEQISTILSSYKQTLNPTKPSITITSITKDILSVENADRLNYIYQLVQAFAFCCIAKNQYFQPHRNYVNASCFELVSQKFVYGEDGVAFISYKKDGSSADGGYRYKDIEILSPSWVRQCHNFNIDLDLLKSLETCLNKNKALYIRIYNGIQWFLLSFTDNPVVSKDLELACLQISIEQLDQSKITSKWLYDLFKYNIQPLPKNYENPKGIWYHELKNYRDKIFHGSLKKKGERWDINTHLFIGTIIIVSSIKRLLEKHGFYNLTHEDRAIDSARGSWSPALYPHYSHCFLMS